MCFDLVRAALDYAKRGWPVFPCSRVNKSPLTMNGFKDASIDESMIRAWWQCHPDAMIGIRTGRAAGIFVLDINPPQDKTKAWCLDKLNEVIGPVVHDTMQVWTPNGFHIYFKQPKDVEIRNRGKLLDGAIDCVRGEGGYAIAAPSINVDGKQYIRCFVDSVQHAPDSLVELVRPKCK